MEFDLVHIGYYVFGMASGFVLGRTVYREMLSELKARIRELEDELTEIGESDTIPIGEPEEFLKQYRHNGQTWTPGIP